MPVLAEKTCRKLRRPHRSGVEWAAALMAKVRHWQPDRELVLVGDGAYAAVGLLHACQSLPRARLVSRLRLDAVLHDLPTPQSPNKRGPKPLKGLRQPNLATRLTAPETV